jgi:hypothetical protein
LLCLVSNHENFVSEIFSKFLDKNIVVNFLILKIDAFIWKSIYLFEKMYFFVGFIHTCAQNNDI